MKSQIALTLALSVLVLQVLSVLCQRERCSQYCRSSYGARSHELCRSCCVRNGPRGLYSTTMTTGECMSTGQWKRFGRQKCVCGNYPVMQKLQGLGGRISGAIGGLYNRYRPWGGGGGSMGSGGLMGGGEPMAGGEGYGPTY